MSGPSAKRQKSTGNFKALILVGGYGTRLRPFTFSQPKPLVPFVGKPILLHQIEALVKVGVTEIILAVNYQPKKMVDALAGYSEKFGIKITMSQEDVPLGTAGPLALAREILGANNSPFFMFNSDVICEFPLQAMLDFHMAHGCEGTITTTPVEDPSKYGVVLAAENGKISSFIEKPQKFVSDQINAGLYLFSPTILKRIELKPTSIEREIFPEMAKDGQLYRMVLPGYWMDIGQPKDYLIGQSLHLKALASHSPGDLAKESKSTGGYKLIGNVTVDASAKIASGAVIGPDVVIGPNVEIGAGARVKQSTLFKGVKVGASAYVASSIIGWSSNIGDFCRLDGCFFGEDVVVKGECAVTRVSCCPHKGIGEDTSDKIVL
eukprot:gb/GEZN01005867.1/.p1 GENE.gb/GEZN01005867.1/~~gb/GEZN01005867.1/.p1  ORF type:complete len:378 (+),score=43.76 gb/GEZN01005867.1/:22-1155(+)